MKKKELKEVFAKDIISLEKLLVKKQSELKKAMIEVLAGKQKNVKIPSLLKKDIAKIKTVLTQKTFVEEKKEEK